MEETRKRWKDEVKGYFNVGSRGDETRQAVRRDRRECREFVWEGKFQHRPTVRFEMIQRQKGVRRGSRRRRRRPDESCVLLGHYAASSGKFLPAFRDKS